VLLFLLLVLNNSDANSITHWGHLSSVGAGCRRVQLHTHFQSVNFSKIADQIRKTQLYQLAKLHKRNKSQNATLFFADFNSVPNRSVYPKIIKTLKVKDAWAEYLKRHPKLKIPIILLIFKIINITIWILATITFLSAIGIDITALITALGLSGFALGLALKDLLSNCIAGILIILYQPFKINSKIIVMDIEGELIDIDMRYTILRNNEGTHLIPNSKLLSEKITVLST